MKELCKKRAIQRVRRWLFRKATVVAAAKDDPFPPPAVLDKDRCVDNINSVMSECDFMCL